MNLLQRLKSVFGYAWAVLCFFVILATFFGIGFWERTFADVTGIRVSPVFSGGEVRQTIDHGTYRTLVHRPVFDGLLGERAHGFVQIDWAPKDKQPLPAVVREEIDIDGDSAAEVSVNVDTASGTVRLTRNASWVLEAEALVNVDSERILRIRLRNPRK